MVEHSFFGVSFPSPVPRNMSLTPLESVSLPIDLSDFDEVIDVRTPQEFDEDHLPGARNLPVLTNEQRVEVGTLFKESAFKGRRLGAGYVSQAIANYLSGPLRNTDPKWTPLIYCWRGGQRSSAVATVLRSVGWRARTLEGGYKAYRRFVMDDLVSRLAHPSLELRVIGGLTGVGKTLLLAALEEAGQQTIDLEKMANHRGSLLGSVGPQPTQRRFETCLHSRLASMDPDRPIYLEAESNRIGSVYLPPSLWQRLAHSNVIELTLPIRERVLLLLEGYRHFLENPESLSEAIEPLGRIRGRAQLQIWHEQIARRAWPDFVTSLLENHYDLCYRQPGSANSNYQPPASQLALSDHSTTSYRNAARTLSKAEKFPAP